VARVRRQLGFEFRTWGGARKGAGRKPKGAKAGVSHLRRPALAARFPVHVTVRMLPHVWNLRSRRSFTIFRKAVLVAADRFGMRLCEFSLQGNHLHLVVEAADRVALARGMKGLGVRLARGLNTLMGRRGRVLADRYHAHILRTPSEVRGAVDYVRRNHAKHARSWARPRTRPGRAAGEAQPDSYSSASTTHGIKLAEPRTWLLGHLGRGAANPARTEPRPSGER
jgi:REP element-mobilizing transposase RayT